MQRTRQKRCDVLVRSVVSLNIMDAEVATFHICGKHSATWLTQVTPGVTNKHSIINHTSSKTLQYVVAMHHDTIDMLHVYY